METSNKMNSKMFITKNETPILINNQYILNCTHYKNQIYYECSSINNGHIHCGRCGIILKDYIKLHEILNDKSSSYYLYTYRGSCIQLTNHHSIFYI